MMTTAKPAILSFQRFGPYHKARLRAVASQMPVIGLELGTVDCYAWDSERPPDDAQIITAFPNENPDAVAPARLVSRLNEIISKIDPLVVAVPGWGQRCALGLLQACKMGGLPTILMSDSIHRADKGNFFRDRLKMRLSNLYQAALVAGDPHKQYLKDLNFREEKIFLGYDVVDNKHFSDVATTKADINERRVFLVVSRFVEGKNIEGVIRAYAEYLRVAEDPRWRLWIVGDGPTRPSLHNYAKNLGVDDLIQWLGFKQYDELPKIYNGASCLINASMNETWALNVNEAMAAGLPVLASVGCGCVHNLLQDGVNGYVFNPMDSEGLAILMIKFANGGVDVKRFGEASRRIISSWDLDRFVDGFECAARAAATADASSYTSFDRALLPMLMRI